MDRKRKRKGLAIQSRKQKSKAEIGGIHVMDLTITVGSDSRFLITTSCLSVSLSLSSAFKLSDFMSHDMSFSLSFLTPQPPPFFYLSLLYLRSIILSTCHYNIGWYFVLPYADVDLRGGPHFMKFNITTTTQCHGQTSLGS